MVARELSVANARHNSDRNWVFVTRGRGGQERWFTEARVEAGPTAQALACRNP